MSFNACWEWVRETETGRGQSHPTKEQIKQQLKLKQNMQIWDLRVFGFISTLLMTLDGNIYTHTCTTGTSDMHARKCHSLSSCSCSFWWNELLLIVLCCCCCCRLFVVVSVSLPFRLCVAIIILTNMVSSLDPSHLYIIICIIHCDHHFSICIFSCSLLMLTGLYQRGS